MKCNIYCIFCHHARDIILRIHVTSRDLKVSRTLTLTGRRFIIIIICAAPLLPLLLLFILPRGRFFLLFIIVWEVSGVFYCEGVNLNRDRKTREFWTSYFHQKRVNNLCLIHWAPWNLHHITCVSGNQRKRYNSISLPPQIFICYK